MVDLTGGPSGKLDELPMDRINTMTITHLLCGTNQLKELPPWREHCSGSRSANYGVWTFRLTILGTMELHFFFLQAANAT